MLRVLSILVLTTLLSACAQPQESQPQVEEPTVRDVRGEEFSYEVDGEPYTGYIAYDANSSGRPGVLVVHQWWGHSDYVRRRADMLADLGYTALALDMYGAGKVADHPDGAQAFMMEVLNNLDAGVERFQTALEILKEHPSTDSTKTAAIGYCFGGGVVLEMARRGLDLDAVASFHGGFASETRIGPGDVSAKILVLHGADDPFMQPEQIEAFKTEMTAAGADMRFVSYPGAVHGFTDSSATRKGEAFGLPLRYDAAADSASWSELRGLLVELWGEPIVGD
jgi:dienelactone hydrolase